MNVRSEILGRRELLELTRFTALRCRASCSAAWGLARVASLADHV